MRLHIKNNIPYYSFEKMQTTNLFSTRHGGVSTGYQSTMNLDFNKDSKENVLENFRLLSTLGFEFESLTAINQQHTNTVKPLTLADKGNKISTPDNFGIAYGFVTNSPDITLVTTYADCTPLYFYDSIKKVIGLSHAGWRGTVDNIAKNTIDVMVSNYGSNPKDIVAGIGPCIGSCCFYVDTPVYDEFVAKLPFSKDHIIKEGEKYRINLSEINKINMLNQGLKEDNIEVANICTCCNNEMFHTHRKSGLNRGCMVAMMRL